MRMKPNEWLENKEFLQKSGYPDQYYLETLCHHVNSCLKNVPIPVLSTLDRKNWRIFLTVGQDKKGIKFNNDISPYDFITLCKKFLIQFYPKYEIEYQSEEDYTDEEYYEMVKKGTPLNDALAIKKIVSKKEIGIIEKCMFPDDQFILNIDGKRYIRMSGTMMNPCLLKDFLPKVREITDMKLKKEFILSNSVLVKEIEGKEKDIEINYSGKMLLNFFKINYHDLIKSKIIKQDDYHYKIGRFHITFSGPQLRDDCFQYLKDRKDKEVLEPMKEEE